jgi:hypothetical protein
MIPKEQLRKESVPEIKQMVKKLVKIKIESFTNQYSEQ